MPSWPTRSTWSRCAPRSSASVSIAPGSCRRRNAHGSLRCSARPRPATTDSCAVTAIPCWTIPTSPPRATRAPSSVGRLRRLSGTPKSMFPAAPSTRDRTAADRLRSSSIAPHPSCPCGVQDGRMREATKRGAMLALALAGERPPARVIQQPSPSKRNVDPVEFELGRNHALMCRIEPRLQAFDALEDCGEVPEEAIHYCLDRIINFVLIYRREASVAHDDGSINDDMAHAAPGLDMNELPHRAVERRPGRVAHVDQRQVRL